MSRNSGVWYGFHDCEAAIEEARKASIKHQYRGAVCVWHDIPKTYDYQLLAVAYNGVVFEPRKEDSA